MWREIDSTQIYISGSSQNASVPWSYFVRKEKPDIAAHVAAPILLQRRDMFLFANSVRAMTAIKYLANAFFLNWQLISIA